ncbi:hypothetical protein [Brevibacterium sp. 2SA]|jgi:hypothetical protein|uniref:hypothetical protein n=1 Tax=Brevibacterium sp. 2SA TaxID=2502198 RepID=UPI0010F977A7|nr:hypothetical protein [Brevibacterium sp. 2SA]
MDTTHTGPAAPAHDTTIATTADDEWTGYAMVRLDDAYRLLDEIGEVIETIEPSRREHASDLLDSAIELLTRLRKRLPPGEPGPPVLGPPF